VFWQSVGIFNKKIKKTNKKLFCPLVYGRQACVPRKFDQDATVCVCNVTHCDNLDPIKKTAKGVVTVFESSKDGDRLKEVELKFGSKATGNATHKYSISIDRTKKYQKIIGFGGSFTDASGFNIKALPEKLQNNIIDDYFGENGIQYNLARVPIGGTDFSTHAYSYDDNHPGDYELAHWNLTKDDFDYKVLTFISSVYIISEKILKNKCLSPLNAQTVTIHEGRDESQPPIEIFWQPLGSPGVA
jgi:hypothetical protein